MCHLIWLLSRKYGTVWYHPASSKLWYLTALSFVNFQEKLTGTSCDSLRVWSQLCSAYCVFGAGCTFCVNNGVFTQTVGSSGATVFAALPLQLVRRIYKMDRRFIPRCLGFHLVNQLVWRLHRRLLLRYRQFIRRCLFFSFLARFWPLIFSFWHVVFLHPWDLEVSTKTC
jgi:hypothetical protein